MELNNKIEIRHLNDDFAVQLVKILNDDLLLREHLSSNRSKVSREEFNKKNKTWAEANRAEMFAIVLNESALGLISLSKIDIHKKTAVVGYWLSSSFWGNGVTTQAFKKLLAFAKDRGIQQLSARIKPDNIASRRIWERYHADVELRNGMLNVSVKL